MANVESTSPTTEDHVHAEHQHEHPSDGTYIKVALVLGAITAAEVGVYYIDLSTEGLLLLLIPMMVAKFAIVAAFFMHLRFDSKLFRYFFLTGLAFATVCYLIVLTTFHAWSGG
jgi:cytochrome c oxidase subunit 4